MLQKELAEAKNNVEDLQHDKEEAEKKIIELNATISSLEHDKTRSHTFENSEFKVSVVTVNCTCVSRCVHQWRLYRSLENFIVKKFSWVVESTKIYHTKIFYWNN